MSVKIYAESDEEENGSEGIFLVLEDNFAVRYNKILESLRFQ
jgi:hypothetical protein